MKDQDEQTEWNRLIWALGDGEISEEDKERLVTILRNEPEARKLYVRNMAMESLLQWENPPAEGAEGLLQTTLGGEWRRFISNLREYLL